MKSIKCVHLLTYNTFLHFSKVLLNNYWVGKMALLGGALVAQLRTGIRWLALVCWKQRTEPLLVAVLCPPQCAMATHTCTN